MYIRKCRIDQRVIILLDSIAFLGRVLYSLTHIVMNVATVLRIECIKVFHEDLLLFLLFSL